MVMLSQGGLLVNFCSVTGVLLLAITEWSVMVYMLVN